MWQAYDRQPMDAAMRLIVAAVQPYDLSDLLEALPHALRRYERQPSVAQALSCLNDQMESLANATVGSDFGVENSGLCLLVSWTNELIRQGSG